MSEEETKSAEETKIYCYDCLKTKGFAITIPIIIGSAILTMLTVSQVLNWNWLIFISGWGFLFFLTFGSFVLSGYCLKEYCRVKSEDYKNPSVIGIFGILAIVGIVVTIGIAYYFPENLDWWLSEHRSWN